MKDYMPVFRLRSLWFPVSALVVLSACSNAKQDSRPKMVSGIGMVQQVSNRAQLEDVVALLMAGDQKTARKKLVAMAKRDPNDQQTATLLTDLGADPLAALGTKTFTYRVQAGDRMTTIAQRFLGNRLKFYLLARYNGIAIPASLAPGQSLRIPGSPPPSVSSPAPKSLKPGPVRSAAPVAAQAKPAVIVPVRPDARRATQLRGQGLAALNAGNVGRAVGLLRQATSADNTNPVIKRDLMRALRIQATVKARR